jgi:transcriptional antiterminator
MAAPEDWDIHQVDIVSAYLASKLKEDIYMKPPEGLNLLPGLYLHLKRALYRLKQSGRA